MPYHHNANRLLYLRSQLVDPGCLGFIGFSGVLIGLDKADTDEPLLGLVVLISCSLALRQGWLDEKENDHGEDGEDDADVVERWVRDRVCLQENIVMVNKACQLACASRRNGKNDRSASAYSAAKSPDKGHKDARVAETQQWTFSTHLQPEEAESARRPAKEKIDATPDRNTCLHKQGPA